MTTSYIMDSLSFLATGMSEVFLTIKSIVSTVLEVNHDIMSVLIRFTVNLFSALWAALNFVLVVIYTILVCVVDFVTELANFVAAFLYLIWKLFILLYSFLDLVFHSIECAVYFLWTGGKWTAETIRVSGNNLTENGLGTWKYFVLSVKDFSGFIVGGFTTIGCFTKSAGYLVYEGMCLVYDYTCEGIYTVDIFVRDVCRYAVDSLSYFFTDYITTLPQEAYFGVLVTCLMGLIFKNVFQIMYSEGFVFPIWCRSSSSLVEGDDENYNAARGEFSDDEDFIDLTITEYGQENDEDDPNYHDDEFSVNSDVSGSSDNDSFDEDDELEIDSESDNESNAPSESEMSEINIQLPEAVSQYDLRRSTTPARLATKDMTSDDLFKVIDSEKERRRCVVCQDRTKSVLILPCRHMCLCVVCGNQIARSRSRERRKCPLCRAKINTIMNVYI